jgi:hypothetical protein
MDEIQSSNGKREKVTFMNKMKHKFKHEMEL